MAVPSSTVRFCEDLANQFPDLRKLLNDHVSDNDELLPHVFFGDVTRWVLNDGKDRRRLIELLESALCSEDPDLHNLIAVSFVENVESEEVLWKRCQEPFS